MSLFYKFAYAVGFTPWERAGSANRAGFEQLLAREESEHGGPGRALDLGCGAGIHSVELAGRGWDVTGVDAVPRALTRARERAAQHDLGIRFIEADVTRLDPATVGGEFAFFLDLGCFHGLNPEQRAATGRSVTAVAAPDATLLTLAFQPGKLPPPLPRGADRADVEAAYPGWSVIDVQAAPTVGMPKLVRRAEPTFYRLRRNG